MAVAEKKRTVPSAAAPKIEGMTRSLNAIRDGALVWVPWFGRWLTLGATVVATVSTVAWAGIHPSWGHLLVTTPIGYLVALSCGLLAGVSSFGVSRHRRAWNEALLDVTADERRTVVRQLWVGNASAMTDRRLRDAERALAREAQRACRHPAGSWLLLAYATVLSTWVAIGLLMVHLFRPEYIPAVIAAPVAAVVLAEPFDFYLRRRIRRLIQDLDTEVVGAG